MKNLHIREYERLLCVNFAIFKDSYPQPRISQPIGIVNNFKLTNQSERNGLIKTPLRCKSVGPPHKNSLKLQISRTTP